METKFKAVLYLSRKSVSALITFVRHIVELMTGNPAYVTPEPSMAELTTAVDELEEAEENKKTTGTTLRNVKLKAMKNLLVRLVNYINLTADGDQLVIESAGVEVAKERQPKESPGEVIGLKVKVDNLVGAAWLSHKGAGSGPGNIYSSEYTTDMALTDGSWKAIPPTGKRRQLVTGLTSGTKVAFRVRASNSGGFGPWSSIAFRTIQ